MKTRNTYRRLRQEIPFLIPALLSIMLLIAGIAYGVNLYVETAAGRIPEVTDRITFKHIEMTKLYQAYPSVRPAGGPRFTLRMYHQDIVRMEQHLENAAALRYWTPLHKSGDLEETSTETATVSYAAPFTDLPLLQMMQADPESWTRELLYVPENPMAAPATAEMLPVTIELNHRTNTYRTLILLGIVICWFTATAAAAAQFESSHRPRSRYSPLQQMLNE